LFGGIAEAFEDRNFRFYSVGAIVSWLSFFVQSVAVSWTAWELTHSTRWLAIVALMDAAPNIALMPIGGVLADRFDRFRLLQTAYALATLQAAVLASFAFSGRLTIEILAGLAFCHGAIHAFSIPAQFGFLPRFVRPARLSPAIAVSAAYTQLGIFLGPALAGWIIGQFGTAVAFATNVVGYGVYFGFIALLRTPPGYRQPPPSGKSHVADFVEGLRAMSGHRGVTAILTLMLSGDALGAAVRQMLPAYSDIALRAGVGGLAGLLACGGIGATLAALWLAQGGGRRSNPEVIIWAFPGILAAVVALTSARNVSVAGMAMIGLGASFEICRTGAVALLQLSIPDQLRGRVMSTQFLLLRLSGALGVAAIGAAAPAWGLRAPLLLGAVAALSGWILTFRARGRIAAAFAKP
jgi:MFS family permease